MDKKEKKKLKKFLRWVYHALVYDCIGALAGFGFIFIKILMGSNVMISIFWGLLLSSAVTSMLLVYDIGLNYDM